MMITTDQLAVAIVTATTCYCVSLVPLERRVVTALRVGAAAVLVLAGLVALGVIPILRR